jgi:hypothetical protein
MSLTIDKPMNYVIVIVGFLFAIASFFLYRFRDIPNKR